MAFLEGIGRISVFIENKGTSSVSCWGGGLLSGAPKCAVERQDSEDVMQNILSISYTDWKKMGFSKGTLHYMKENAKDDEPFTLNAHVRGRVEVWDVKFHPR